MPFLETHCYQASCDLCGYVLEVDYVVHFDRKSDVTDWEDWWLSKDETVVLCDPCRWQIEGALDELCELFA